MYKTSAHIVQHSLSLLQLVLSTTSALNTAATRFYHHVTQHCLDHICTPTPTTYALQTGLPQTRRGGAATAGGAG